MKNLSYNKKINRKAYKEYCFGVYDLNLDFLYPTGLLPCEWRVN